MEYDETKTQPELHRKFLIQQFEEQSNLCDVSVKRGLWEKKFHRCVLVISPFFDHVLNDNFLEKQTGKIEIGIGTSVSLEAAILFLYGKKPKLKNDNVADILQMAEFLLIPNLKSACIAWMKSATITEENCLEFLQLSSMYDFEIPKCINYIEEHLPEMLLHPEMVNLTKESVHLLFSDKRLSYVSMDDKLLFLLKWSNAKPNTRKVHLKELLMIIDFKSISKQCLDGTLDNPDVGDHVQSEQIFPSDSAMIDSRVLIFKRDNYDNYFWGLDLERDQWFRVFSEVLNVRDLHANVAISGTYTKTSGSIICSQIINYRELSLFKLNLALDTCTILNFTGIEDDSLNSITNLIIEGQTCAVSVNEEVNIFKEKTFDDLGDFEINGNMRSMYIHIGTLYIGRIAEIDIKMSPILSFKDEIREVAISKSDIAVILRSCEYIAIYNIDEGRLVKVNQTTHYYDKIVNFKDGFVIHNNERFLTISKAHKTCFSNQYQVKEIPLEQNGFVFAKYFLRNEMWYRYYRKTYSDNFIFESAPFQALLSRKPDESIAWKQLPLPKEAASCSSDTFAAECFEVLLPKSILRCHTDCPHCKLKARATMDRDVYHQDDDDYDDYVHSSSDELFYVESDYEEYDDYSYYFY